MRACCAVLVCAVSIRAVLIRACWSAMRRFAPRLVYTSPFSSAAAS